MATITVEPTESGILISEAGNDEAATGLDRLPPLTAARYLFVSSDSAESLRQAEMPLVDSIRPHAHSTLVALEAGFAAAIETEDEPPAKKLAAALGVTVVAPEGRFLSCDGALFAIGADSSWVSYGPLGAKAVHGKRYPEPAWQTHLPSQVAGAVQIPAGLWITAGADASHAVHLADITVHPQQLLIVVGSPSEPAPELSRLRDVLRALSDQTRASAVLIGYGETSLELETIRLLSAELQEPLRIAHGASIAGEFVRLDLARETPTRTFAKESVCTPDGWFELDRWAAPLGMPTVSRNTYQLARDWVVDVVRAGLVVRPAHQLSNGVGESLAVVAEVFTVMLCGDGVEDLKHVVPPLRQLLGRLRGYAKTQLIPGDRAATRVIRDAFPGMWAPTARLALTEDGRIIAASVDENELVVVAEKEQSNSREVVDQADQHRVSSEAEGIRAADQVRPNGEAIVKKSPAPAQKATVPEQLAAPDLQDRLNVAHDLTGAASLPAAQTAEGAHEHTVGVRSTPVGSSSIETIADSSAQESAPQVEVVSSRRSAQPNTSEAGSMLRDSDTQGGVRAAPALPRAAGLPSVSASDPSDALARALRGSSATADLLTNRKSRTSAFDAADAVTGAAGRGSAELTFGDDERGSSPRSAVSPQRRANSLEDESASGDIDDVASDEDADVVTSPTTIATEHADLPHTSTPADEVVEPLEIDVPRVARSTAEQRHRVRSLLGARYDVASRNVSQLLAQQPGMRVSSGDRSTLLTTLSVVSVFADDPIAQYDIDFHTCLAEGLAALPTTRSIVVRGLPATSTASMNSMLYSRTPFLSAPVDGPLTGPMEALIWTTSGRRLDRLMVGTSAATDVILPAHTPLRVLGTSEGPVRRLLLAEDGVNDDNVLTRLHDVAASRDADPSGVRDSRWLGELLAVE